MGEFLQAEELIDQNDGGCCSRSTFGELNAHIRQCADESGPPEEPSGSTMNFDESTQQNCLLQSFVIVYNVAKRHNIGTLTRCATAFGVSEIILVGKRKDFNAFGSHGAAAHLHYRHFYNLGDARSHLKRNGCDIIGIEIIDGAIPVHSHPFTRSAAFLLGNEGTGLSKNEMAICDYFIYISQYGGGTASLNVSVAASIVLHHFAVWAGFLERPRDGHKFQVADRPSKPSQRVVCIDSPELVAELRQSKRSVAEDWLVDEEDFKSGVSVSEKNDETAGRDSSSALTRLFQD